jgi:hypothetical protein
MKNLNNLGKIFLFRIIIGIIFLIMVVVLLMLMKHTFFLGLYLFPIYIVFVISFCIFGVNIRVGFGSERVRIFFSYVIFIFSIIGSVYVLWNSNDPTIIRSRWAGFQPANFGITPPPPPTQPK